MLPEELSMALITSRSLASVQSEWPSSSSVISSVLRPDLSSSFFIAFDCAIGNDVVGVAVNQQDGSLDLRSMCNAGDTARNALVVTCRDRQSGLEPVRVHLRVRAIVRLRQLEEFLEIARCRRSTPTHCIESGVSVAPASAA